MAGTEAGAPGPWLWLGGGATGPGMGAPPEAGKVREQILPWSLQQEPSPPAPSFQPATPPLDAPLQDCKVRTVV